MRYTLTCLIPATLFLGCVAAIYLLEIRLLFKWFRRRIRKQPTARMLTTRPAAILHALSVTGLLCLAWAYFVEPYRLEICTFTIPTDKLTNTSFRIVQISDLHCEKKSRLEPRLVEEINRLKPDLAVFTGDALNDHRALDLLRHTLRDIIAPLGKFAVRGNVDNRRWKDIPLFQNTGFIELTMDALTVEKDTENIGLCGIDEALGRRSRQALKDLRPERFNILLFHTTALVDYMQPYPLDLYLCGHTHGGQVALPLYGALVTQSIHGKKYEAGLYKVGSLCLYVNRGIGMTGRWAPRIRFFARPEITVFDIVPADPSPDSEPRNPSRTKIQEKTQWN